MDILKKLKKAGIHWLAYGIESADDEVLSEVSKSQYNADKTKCAMQWTKEAGINILANFMFGLPDDTLESMEKSLQNAIWRLKKQLTENKQPHLYHSRKQNLYAKEKELAQIRRILDS